MISVYALSELESNDRSLWGCIFKQAILYVKKTQFKQT